MPTRLLTIDAALERIGSGDLTGYALRKARLKFRRLCAQHGIALIPWNGVRDERIVEADLERLINAKRAA